MIKTKVDIPKAKTVLLVYFLPLQGSRVRSYATKNLLSAVKYKYICVRECMCETVPCTPPRLTSQLQSQPVNQNKGCIYCFDVNGPERT